MSLLTLFRKKTDTRNEPTQREYALQQEQKKKEQEEYNKKHAAEIAMQQSIKEFQNLRSICLDCQNAFEYRYMQNPEKSNEDPLIVICKIAPYTLNKWNHPFDHECFDNAWYRKCVHCSEFKQKEKI